jgi:hypothetical protein
LTIAHLSKICTAHPAGIPTAWTPRTRYLVATFFRVDPAGRVRRCDDGEDPQFG